MNQNGDNLVDQGNQFVNYMLIYRYPIVLNLNYMRTILKLGNQTAAANNIAKNTQEFINIASSDLTLKSLYDKNLNP